MSLRRRLGTMRRQWEGDSSGERALDRSSAVIGLPYARNRLPLLLFEIKRLARADVKSHETLLGHRL